METSFITESFIKTQQIEKIFKDSRYDFGIRLMKLLAMNLKIMETSQTKEEKSLRSESTLYDKTKCIFCQVLGGKSTLFSAKKTGKKMLKVANKLASPNFSHV